MDYLVLCRGKIERAVPIMSAAIGLSELGMRVTVVCSISQSSTKDYLAKSGIGVIDIDEKYKMSHSTFQRLRNWFIFRKKIRAYLKAVERDNVVLYVGTADTAMAAGDILLKYRYILHIRELYDEFPRYIRGLKKYAKGAKKIVVPEYNRGAIFRSWFGLQESPVIMPNKPINHPASRHINIMDDLAREAIGNCKGRKIVLYQGNITPDRDLSAVADAMKYLGEEYVLVLLGPSRHGALGKIQAINSNIIHIPYVAAPGHLQITSHAHIGLVTYTYKSLNNIFCAPNKIWEYAGFGIPMLANNIPGLKYTVGHSQIGSCVDYGDALSIVEGIKKIEENYDLMAANSVRFFNSLNITDVLKQIVLQSNT